MELKKNTIKEANVFISIFSKYKSNPKELKDRFDWYYERYMQMLDADEDNFTEWMVGEFNRQNDEIEAFPN